jgi:DNA-binding XRE family transcriptional regulator
MGGNSRFRRLVGQRACARCGAGLRRGRSGGVCDPCSRCPDIAERLREAGFFTQEPIRRALAAYDFGYLFRAVRRTAGLTQVELGELLELDQDRISRIERGQRQLKDIETIARIATRLGIPPMLLGFSADTTSVAAQSAAPAHDLPTEPAPGTSSLTLPPESDAADPSLTELTRHPCVVSEMSYSSDNGIAEYSEERFEGTKSPFLLSEEDVILMEPMPTRQVRSMEAILMDAADESAKILAWAEVANVGDLTIEQIHVEIRRIAHSYLKVPTLPLFDRTRELRDRIVGLLNGRQKPSHSRELYSAAGWALTMLAWISTDLNVPDASEEHLRTAWIFAENADQNNLRSWIRAAQHTAAFWQQDFARAAQYAEDGLRYADSGSTELYLSSAWALDLARCGDGERALAVLNSAQSAAESAGTGEDALSGPFTCSIARAGGFWSDTHLAVGNAKEALLIANSAVKGFESTPNDRRNFGSERMVRCAQVKAHLLVGEFDGASEALMPVFDTTPEHRVRPLLQRVDEIAQMIAGYGKRNSSAVVKMQDAIHEFRLFEHVKLCRLSKEGA